MEEMIDKILYTDGNVIISNAELEWIFPNYNSRKLVKGVTFKNKLNSKIRLMRRLLRPSKSHFKK